MNQRSSSLGPWLTAAIIGAAMFQGCPPNPSPTPGPPTPGPQPVTPQPPTPPPPVVNSPRLVVITEYSTPDPDLAAILLELRQWCKSAEVPLWIADPDSVGPDNQPPPELLPYLAAWRTAGGNLPAICYEEPPGSVLCEPLAVSSFAAAVDQIKGILGQ